MFVSYIVGNVEAQLTHGKNFNSHCSGVEEVAELIAELSNRFGSTKLEQANLSLEEASEYGDCQDIQ